MTQIQNHKLEGTVKVPIPARTVIPEKAGIHAFQEVLDYSIR